MDPKYQNTSDTLEIVAVVIDNDDPEKKGRFKIKINGTNYPFWVVPQLQWGAFVVPEVGQKVVVYSEYSGLTDRFEGESSIFAPNYRWKGETIFTTESYEKKHVPNAEFATNYTKRTGFFSKAGHLIIFDDKKGSEDVYVINGKTGCKLQMLSDSSIAMIDDKENKVQIKDNEIKAVHSSGPEVKLTATSIDVDAGATGTSTMSAGVKSEVASTTESRLTGPIVTLAATAQLNISAPGATVVIDGGTIELGEDATDKLLKAAAATVYNTHTHIAAGTPTSTPSVLMTAAHETSTTRAK